MLNSCLRLKDTLLRFEAKPLKDIAEAQGHIPRGLSSESVLGLPWLLFVMACSKYGGDKHWGFSYQERVRDGGISDNIGGGWALGPP